MKSILTEYQRTYLTKSRPLWATCGNGNLEALARFTLSKSLAGLMRKVPKTRFDGLDRLIPSFTRFLFSDLIIYVMEGNTWKTKYHSMLTDFLFF